MTHSLRLLLLVVFLIGCGKLPKPEELLKTEQPPQVATAPPEAAVPKAPPPTPEQIVSRFMGLPNTQKNDEELHQVADQTSQLAGITELELGVSAITDAGAAELPKFTALQRLNLSGARITARSLETVAALPALEVLQVAGIPLEDANVAVLKSASGLTSLNLAGTSISDGSFESLSALERLEALDLSGNDQVLGRTFTELVKQQRFKSLTSIKADNSGFGYYGLHEMSSLPNLQFLSVGHSFVSDEALEGLKSCRSLKHLYLGENLITDAGMPSLKRLTQLEALRLGGNPAITDAGLKELRGLKQLQELRLDGTRCTLEAARELKDRFLKNTRIYIAGQEL